MEDRVTQRLPPKDQTIQEAYDVPANFLEIDVINPETHGVAKKRYTDYEVRMKTNLPIFRVQESSVRRRYSDFEWLKGELEKESKIIVPVLPGKALKLQLPFRSDDGIYEEEFIEERRSGLEQFVNKIAGHPLAQNERCLHMFLTEPIIDRNYICGKSMSAALKKELIFYGCYHNDAINKLIHGVCIPLIVWTFLGMAANVTLFTVPSANFTLAYALALFYTLYYMYLHVAVGMISALVLLAMSYSAHLYWETECEYKWQTLIALNLIGWVAQFIGHGVFEGRRPALVDSAVQAFLTAPFFIFFEYCFLLGLFPELHAEINRGIYKELNLKRE